MQTEKQKWIEDVLQSINGVSRASAPDMADAMLSRISTGGSHTIADARDTSLIWRIAVFTFQPRRLSSAVMRGLP